jgi:hypothetical protein
MSGTVIVPQQVTPKVAAAVPAFVAAAAQMELPNQAPTLLHLKATGAVSITAVNQTSTPEGAPNPNKVTGPIAAGNERVVRFDPATYNMGNGNVQLNIDTPANLTVTAYQLG